MNLTLSGSGSKGINQVKIQSHGSSDNLSYRLSFLKNVVQRITLIKRTDHSGARVEKANASGTSYSAAIHFGGVTLYNGTILLEKHDPPVVYDSEETLQLAQESRLKMKQLNKEIKPTNYAKINQLSGVFVSQRAKSREELYFSNTSKSAAVSKSVSVSNEEFLDDTSPSVARKFLNEEAAKFVRDFKSLAKEADESLAKHKALEFEIERLLRAVVKKEYDVLWNNWYTKCEECKYDKISYDKAYNDMQQKIEQSQAQLGDQKGKSKDTPCVLDTLDPLSQKLENENMELEFQILNYAKENAYLKDHIQEPF
ncbi:hypothetical protein Tco_0016163 [Tanacetum coccineum]